MQPPLTYLAEIEAVLDRANRPHAPGSLRQGIECLAGLTQHLKQSGIAEAQLAPLTALLCRLREERTTPIGLPAKRRRASSSPSDALLARIAATIDLLVRAGLSEEEAAQMMVRRLLAKGVQPPAQGGDSRGWKRLLIWRARLRHGVASEEAAEAYAAFAKEIDSIPAKDRIRSVLDEAFWDRRREGTSSPQP